MTPIAAGILFLCTPVAVWDGDGPIRCDEGPRIRLAAIAAREIDGTCRRGHPCPKASGPAARDHLVQLLGGARGRTKEGHVLVGGGKLRCRSEGADRYGRTVAWCSAPGVGDLSCAQVSAGMALRWRRYGGEKVCGPAGSQTDQRQ